MRYGSPQRVAIYTRYRGEIIDKEVPDAAAQEQRCREFAGMRGYTVVDVFREQEGDPEESRPELKRLRTKIWKRQFDVVVVTMPDRLYEDTTRLLRFLRDAEVLDTRVEFVDVPDDIDFSDYE